MASSNFSWVYMGLGVILGFLFLGIVTELYYLLWLKKKRINTTTEEELEEDNKAPPHTNREITRNPVENPHGFDLERGCSEDRLLKTTTNEDEEEEEEDDDLELMGIYNLAGQPRFLFTIKEETKEDLESEDGKSRKGSRTRSLSDIIAAIETPFFTPMASPLESYKFHGVNPLFESSAELEQNLNRFRSSPPPKFKFLRDAEEKLYRRLMEEEAQRRAAEIKDRDQDQRRNAKKPINQRFSSQVLPLVSSPPEFHTKFQPCLVT